MSKTSSTDFDQNESPSTSSWTSESPNLIKKSENRKTSELIDGKEPILSTGDEENQVDNRRGCLISSWTWWKSLSKMSAMKLVIFCFVLLGFIVLVILSVIPHSPIRAVLQDVVKWIDQIPKYYSYPIMAVMYILLVPLGCPITPINLVSGYLFGIWAGTAISTVGSMIGAMICFILALTLAKEWADKMLQSTRIFKAIQIIVRNEAWKLILLAHLSPILPSTILNYVFASMGVQVFTFAWATLLGIFPLILAYCYIGSLASGIMEAFNGGGEKDQWWKLLIYITVVIITTSILIGFFAWVTKRELRKAMALLESEEANPLLGSTIDPQKNEEKLGLVNTENSSKE